MDNVEPPIHVLYAVWEPSTGWVRLHQERDGRTRYGKKPKFWTSYGYALRLAMRLKAQLVTFDVTPSLRSWPSLCPAFVPPHGPLPTSAAQ